MQVDYCGNVWNLEQGNEILIESKHLGDFPIKISREGAVRMVKLKDLKKIP